MSAGGPEHQHNYGHDHGHGHGHGGGPQEWPEVFDQAWWDGLYASQDALWSGNPNVALVTEASDLPAGRALEVGCGEGGDAIWLARRGWTVVATDLSEVALARAREHAQAAGPGIDGAITFRHADLTAWVPEPGGWDLVSAFYVHMPADDRAVAYGRLADAVAPGGTLLIVGHHPDAPRPGPPPPAGMFFLAEDLAAGLDSAQWEIVTSGNATRPATLPDGTTLEIIDTVLRARRKHTQTIK